MKDQTVVHGIVIARINFQEADRIVTVLTPTHGKLKLMVKGARRAKSKLAGGIELFSLSSITFIPGRKEIGTMISSRLINHYGDIVKNINKTMLGYEFLKRINQATEEGAGADYFNHLKASFSALSNNELSSDLMEFWFNMQLLRLSGFSPNLKHDNAKKLLEESKCYEFNSEDMHFVEHPQGQYSSKQIKLLRLGIGLDDPSIFLNIKDASDQASKLVQLSRTMLNQHIRT